MHCFSSDSIEFLKQIRHKEFYNAKFDFQFMTKKDDAISGVVFRYQNPYNFYSMEMYEKVLSIKKMKDGKMEGKNLYYKRAEFN